MKNKKSYADKLKNPLWQKKRLEILDRDNFKCVHCESQDRELHVHLKYDFKKEIWELDNDCYETVCKLCHEQITDVNNRFKNAISDLDISEKEFVIDLIRIHREYFCNKYSDIIINNIDINLF